MSILSLDVSASSTGWCFTSDGKSFEVGTIVTLPKYSRGERLNIFANELKELLQELTPSYIVMEDTFAGKNTKTLKILSEFAGVTKYICSHTLNVEPVVIANTKVKSYFKTRTKELLFGFACELFEENNLTFKKDNDIMDAKMQLLFFADEVLNRYKYRFDKDYGYIYMEDY